MLVSLPSFALYEQRNSGQRLLWIKIRLGELCKFFLHTFWPQSLVSLIICTRNIDDDLAEITKQNYLNQTFNAEKKRLDAMKRDDFSPKVWSLLSNHHINNYLSDLFSSPNSLTFNVNKTLPLLLMIFTPTGIDETGKAWDYNAAQSVKTNVITKHVYALQEYEIRVHVCH